MDTTTIYIQAYELAEAIRNSDLFQTYKRLQVELTEDPEMNALMEQFKKKQEAFEEVNRFGSYHPDFGRVKKAYQDIKIELMKHHKFKHFKRIEKELETTIFQIEEALQQLVDVSNKHKKSTLKFMLSYNRWRMEIARKLLIIYYRKNNVIPKLAKHGNLIYTSSVINTPICTWTQNSTQRWKRSNDLMVSQKVESWSIWMFIIFPYNRWHSYFSDFSGLRLHLGRFYFWLFVKWWENFFS